MLEALAVEGRALEAACSCWRSPTSWPRSMRRAPRSAARGAPSRCCATIADTAASFDREIADVRRKIDPGGEVADDASPELRSLRDRLRKQRARLRGTLESYLRGKDTSKYLQQQIVTDRNGRYVLVVRAEHRARDSGHRPRQFGQRRQPVPRAAQHRRDQQRHRRARTAGGGGSPADPAGAGRRVPAAAADDLQRTVDAATALDVLQARAQFLASLVDGIAPAIADRRTPRTARRTPPAADSGGAPAPRCPIRRGGGSRAVESTTDAKDECPPGGGAGGRDC